MRLAAKFVSLLVLGMILVVAVEAYVSTQRDVKIFEDEMRQDAKQLARTLKDLVADVWRTNGQRRALQLVEDANQEQPLVDVRWVWLDAAASDSDRPRVSSAKLPSLQDGKPVSVQERDATGRGFLYTYVPMDVEPERRGALEISRRLDGLDTFRRAAIVRACVVAGTLTVASGMSIVILGLVLVGRPLNQLVEKTRRVGNGDLSGPLVLKRHDEMAELAVALNQMCEHLDTARENLRVETEARITALEQLRHADRLTTVGRLASGMAHELGTPLNVASARADLIVEDTHLDDVAKSARIIKIQVDKMTTIVRELLDFARQHAPRKSSENVPGLVAQTIEMLDTLTSAHHVGVHLTSEQDRLMLELDSGQFQQVLTNLLVNAVHAMPRGGTIDVGVRRVTARPPDLPGREPQPCLRIDVRDEGVGIPAEHRNQIFDPFFTTKDIGKGTGLGLSIAHSIVREHGGWMDVASEVQRGTCFSIYLPENGKSCARGS